MKLWAALKRTTLYDRLGAPLLVALTALFVLTPLGPYANDYVFVRAASTLAGALGRGAKLPDELRVIVQDDRSYREHGRSPTFAEWLAIAELLFAEGYEKVFLLGMFDMPTEVGSLHFRSGVGRLYAGTVVAAEPSSRTMAYDDRELDGLLPSRPPGTGDAWPEARDGYVPDRLVRQHVDAIGSLNLGERFTVPLAHRLGVDRFVPHISLYAAEGLTMDEGGLRHARGRVATGRTGEVVVDVVSPAAIHATGLPSRAFFDPETRAVIRRLTPALKKRLAGGRVAAIAPDAFTGSRFVETHQGKVLGYVVGVSAIASVMNHRYLYRTLEGPAPLAAWALMAFFAFRVLRGRRAGLSCAAVAVAIVACGVVLVFATGAISPVTPAVAIVLAAGGLRAGTDAFRVASERAGLRRDLEMGRMVQTVLLPAARSGRIGRWDYRIVFRPYGFLSGDWFQACEGVDAAGRPFAVLAIGDCVGKGTSAALCTVVIASVWRQFERRWRAGEAPDVVSFAASLHDAIFDVFKGEQHTTLSMAVVTHDTVAMLGIAAPTWVIWDAAQKAGQRVKRRPGNPLGAARSERGPIVATTRGALRAGDLLVGYTDGFLDGTYAERAFVDRLAALPLDGPEEAAFAAIEGSMAASVEPTALPDDSTLLMIRCRSEAAAEGSDAA